MLNRVLAVACTIGSASVAFADPPGDPNAMLTNELQSYAAFYTIHDNDKLTFDPASAYAECAHAQVGAVSNASISVTDRCSSSLAGVDIVEFQWSNLNMHSSLFGITALGVGKSHFNLLNDAELSLSAMTNLSSLNGGASWTLELFDGESNFIGDLNNSDDTYSLEKNVDYSLIFRIDGTNTLTAGGSTVAWQMSMAYSGSGDESSGGGDGGGGDGGGSVAPGAGGLALLGSLGLSRRRRRR